MKEDTLEDVLSPLKLTEKPKLQQAALTLSPVALTDEGTTEQDPFTAYLSSAPVEGEVPTEPRGRTAALHVKPILSPPKGKVVPGKRIPRNTPRKVSPIKVAEGTVYTRKVAPQLSTAKQGHGRTVP